MGTTKRASKRSDQLASLILSLENPHLALLRCGFFSKQFVTAISRLANLPVRPRFHSPDRIHSSAISSRQSRIGNHRRSTVAAPGPLAISRYFPPDDLAARSNFLL